MSNGLIQRGKNLESWAMRRGYNPQIDYTDIEDTPVPSDHYSRHFAKHEFGCKHCGYTITPPPLLLLFAELLRHKAQAPVTITSATRCTFHNDAVGGEPNSHHLTGIALDVKTTGMDPYDVYIYMDTLVGDMGGVGLYDDFTHFDVRGHYSRW